jgi:hypothetical protein
MKVDRTFPRARPNGIRHDAQICDAEKPIVTEARQGLAQVATGINDGNLTIARPGRNLLCACHDCRDLVTALTKNFAALEQ